jgi:hypothetical protein
LNLNGFSLIINQYGKWDSNINKCK